jgi:hypothetical protein
MNILEKLQKLLITLRGEFLCDTCKYDYPSACKNSARPNVKKCPEYKKRM